MSENSQVKLVKSQHWRRGETDYVLGYIASHCTKCDKDIPEDEAGYIVDGPEANGGSGGFGELCFGCGGEVTGFGQ